MATKEKVIPVCICDLCGKEIDIPGEFSVTMWYNNASYRKPGESTVGFEASPKGDYCLKCADIFSDRFCKAMKSFGIAERYEKQHMSIADEVERLKQWQKEGK